MDESRFIESFDGTRIAYRAYGKGSPAVFLSNGIGCNQVFLDYLIRDLASHYRTVVWDYRSHVDSDVPEDRRAVSMDCFMRDMQAAMDAAGVKRAVLGGFSMGVQVSLEFLSRFPERAEGLLLLCGTYEHLMRSFFYVGPLLDAVFPLLLYGMEHNPERVQAVWTHIFSQPWVFQVARQFVFNRDAVKQSDFDRYQPHIANIDVQSFLHTCYNIGRYSSKDVLSDIRMPTLVVAGEKDNFSPLSVCRRMHEQIQDAEWMLVEGGSHGSLIEFPERINERVLDFMSRHFGNGKGRRSGR